jgi:hypothetical protein
MTTVPENWIPFVPVHVDGDNREVQLQRSAWMQGPAMERKHGVDWPGVPEPAR